MPWTSGLGTHKRLFVGLEKFSQPSMPYYKCGTKVMECDRGPDRSSTKKAAATSDSKVSRAYM